MGLVSGATTYLENKLLDHVLRNTAYTPAATVYAGLFTTHDAAGEVTGTGYARQAMAFSAASGTTISNSGTVSWGPLGAPWGNIFSAGIYDALTGGNLLCHGPLANGQATTNGQTLSFAAGTFEIALSEALFPITFPINLNSITPYLAQKLLNLTFRNTAYTPPVTVYAGLINDFSGVLQTEVVASGYVRKAMTFSAAAGGATANTGTVSWAAIAASYGTIYQVGIYDASSAGNLLFSGTLDSPVNTATGDTLQFSTTTQLKVAVD